VNVLPQHVKLVRERTRYPGGDAGFLDVVEALDQLRPLFRRRLPENGALERHQLAVAAVDARADAPAVERRDDLQHGNQQHQERSQHDDRAVEETRQPEWQIAVEETFARLVITGGVVADAVFLLARRGKLAGLLQERSSP